MPRKAAVAPSIAQGASAMGRGSWKGTLTFGLVTFPVRLHRATEEKALRFNQLHRGCDGRVRSPRVCEDCGEQVQAGDIVKGYPTGKDEWVVMDDDDFADLPVATKKVVAIDQFIDAAEVDSIAFQKAYYIAPEEISVKAYALVLRAMEAEGKVGLGKVAFRESREYLAVIRPWNGRLVMELLWWPDEIKVADDASFDAVATQTVKPQELAMARQLVASLTEPFDPSAFRDEYRAALTARIEAKVAGLEPVHAAPEPEPAPVYDMEAALLASIQQVKKAKPAPKRARKAS